MLFVSSRSSERDGSARIVKPLAILLTFVSLFLASYAAYDAIWEKPDENPDAVPNDVATKANEVKEEGVKPGNSPGTMIEQAPKAGTQEAHQAPFNRIEPAGIPVPDTVGLTMEQAEIKLLSVGLSIVNRTNKPRQLR